MMQAAPSWGHVASADLVHWMQLPSVALQPAAYYDSDGVFSGSATLLTNGTPAIMYTGGLRRAALGAGRQAAAGGKRATTLSIVARAKRHPTPGGGHARIAAGRRHRCRHAARNVACRSPPRALLLPCLHCGCRRVPL